MKVRQSNEIQRNVNEETVGPGTGRYDGHEPCRMRRR